VSDLLLVERRGDLAFVTLNDPERANALSPALAAELTSVYRRDWRAEGVRALLLAGAGRNFCAGADLEHLAGLAAASPLDHRLDSARLRDLFEAILRQEALTLALVQGSCVAGGCGLATACDFALAADDARFLYSEVRIGFVAALVATWLSLRLRGSDVRELLLAPEFVPAARALELGLVARVVPRAELAAAGERFGGELGVDRAHQAAAAGDRRPPARRAPRPGRRGQRRGARDR
jgi:methylglutaconyl-CoA hydratase